MVSQYPHYLFRQAQPAVSTQDSQGNWIAARGSWVYVGKCREETNGKGAQINGPDGKATVFSSTIYLPKGSAVIPEGTQIMVSDSETGEGVKRISGACLKCSPGQMGVRIWV